MSSHLFGHGISGVGIEADISSSGGIYVTTDTSLEVVNPRYFQLKGHVEPIVKLGFHALEDAAGTRVYLYSLDDFSHLKKFDIARSQLVWSSRPGGLGLSDNIFDSHNTKQTISMEVLPDGKVIVIGKNGNVVLFDENGREHSNPFHGRFSKDLFSVTIGQSSFTEFEKIAFGANDGIVYICDYPLGKECKEKKVSELPIYKIRFIENNHFLAVSDSAGIVLLDIESGDVTSTIVDLELGIQRPYNLKSVDYLGEEGIVFIGENTSVRAVNLVQNTDIGFFSGDSGMGTIRYLKMDEHRQSLVSISSRDEVVLWDIAAGSPVWGKKIAASLFNFGFYPTVAVSKDFKYLAITKPYMNIFALQNEFHINVYELDAIKNAGKANGGVSFEITIGKHN